jgi:hypothetical protein
MFLGRHIVTVVASLLAALAVSGCVVDDDSGSPEGDAGQSGENDNDADSNVGGAGGKDDGAAGKHDGQAGADDGQAGARGGSTDGEAGAGGGTTDGEAGEAGAGTAGSSATGGTASQAGAANGGMGTAGAAGSGGTVASNECEDDPCKNEGTCTDTPTSHICSCKTGYAGLNCEHRTDACATMATSYSTDTTLEAGCYLADHNVSVSALLTLEAGVQIIFAQDVGMIVNSAGAISAQGTVDAPVVLTGERQIPGYWDGLVISFTNSFDNALSHVVIEYAGSGGAADLTLDGSAAEPVRVSIDDCVLRQGAGYGLSADGDTTITSFTHNVLTGNASGAATLHPEVVGDLDDSSSFSGNDNDTVEVLGGTVHSDQTWPGIDVRYHVTGDIGTNALLTLAPGVEMEFAEDVGMSVNASGGLAAIGTEEAPILLTGAVQEPGYWPRLYIGYTNHPENALKYVTIEYAGGTNSSANLILDGSSAEPARVSIDDCVLRQGAGYGLSADADTTIASFTHNVLTGNASGAATVHPEVVGDLDDSSSFSGNDHDRVEIVGGTVVSDQTWPGIDVRYHVAASIGTNALLTLAPGVEMEFAQDVGMSVNASGGLAAIGTEEAPILLTGAVQEPGYWTRLYIGYTNHPENALKYVTIEYAGGTNSSANLILDGSSAEPVGVSIDNCTFRQSGGCGVSLDADTTTDPANLTTTNTFADNAGDDICGP